MNYLKIYNNIINRARVSPPLGYTEVHHIIPRCMGGTNDRTNRVRLSARQHFICHWLLTKIYPSHSGLYNAFHMMFHPTSAKTRKSEWVNTHSRVYARLKEIMSMNMKIRFATHGHPMRGKKHSPETIKKIRETKRLHPHKWTLEDKKRMSCRQKGRPRPLSQKQKVADALAQTWEVITPNGDYYIITNLRQFCRTHHLSQGSIITHGHTKGYKARKIAD